MDKLSKVKTTSSTNESYNLFKTACKAIASEIIPLKDKIKKQTPRQNPEIIDKIRSLKEIAQIIKTQIHRKIIYVNTNRQSKSYMKRTSEYRKTTFKHR